MTDDSLQPKTTLLPAGEKTQIASLPATAFPPRRQSRKETASGAPNSTAQKPVVRTGHPATTVALQSGHSMIAGNSGIAGTGAVSPAPNLKTAVVPPPMGQPTRAGTGPLGNPAAGPLGGPEERATPQPVRVQKPQRGPVQPVAAKPATPPARTSILPGQSANQSARPGLHSPALPTKVGAAGQPVGGGQAVPAGQSGFPGQSARPGQPVRPIPVSNNAASISGDSKPGKQVKWTDVSQSEAQLEANGNGNSDDNLVWAGRAPKKKIPGYRRPYRFDLLSWIGEILITLGLLGGLLAFWDVYVTDWQVKDFNNAAIKQFKQGTKCNNTVSTEIHNEPPPEVKKVGLGDPLAILHYPSWNFMTVPVREGADQYIIDTGAAGHYAETAMPGQIGNFSVAAHRRSYGSNFRRVDTLKEGDPVVVETQDTWIIFKVYNKEIVDPSAGEVIAPVPNRPNEQPTERLMTMTTCHPEYGNWQRYIVHLKYDHWVPKSSGVPEELASGGNACTN